MESVTAPVESTGGHLDPYDHATVEARWRRIWDERGDYRTQLDEPDRPFYNLMMFPYPSAEGLHVGHIIPFAGGDIYGRWRRLMGDTVFEPMGFDAFGIHSENYAMKIGEHPADGDAPRGRQLPREPAETDRFDVRLEPPGQHRRPLVLPLDAVDLRAALQRRAHRVA